MSRWGRDWHGGKTRYRILEFCEHLTEKPGVVPGCSPIKNMSGVGSERALDK